jgi:hypothetical protein
MQFYQYIQRFNLPILHIVSISVSGYTHPDSKEGFSRLKKKKKKKKKKKSGYTSTSYYHHTNIHAHPGIDCVDECHNDEE